MLPRRTRLIVIAALIILAGSAWAAPKVKAGLTAGSTPASATVFRTRQADDGSAFPSAFETGMLDQSIARFGWTPFSSDASGAVNFGGESSFSGLRKSSARVSGVPGLYAVSVDFMGMAAKGGKAYTVTFAPDDLGFFQPDEYAIMRAILFSKKASGSARVVKAAFSKGGFSFVIAVK
jgi:hypothetical protein